MKMIYKIFTVAMLFVAAATFSANAQIYYGIKTGANVTTISAISGLGDSTNGYGYQAGLTLGAKVPLVGIGVEAEALWVNNKITFADYGELASNSIEIPVMATIPLFPLLPISLKVGPSFILHSSAKAVVAGNEIDIDPLKSGVGYTVGLGVKLLKFTLDLRYNGQTKAEDVGTSDIRVSSVSATLGYRF